MLTPQDIAARADEVSVLLADRLGARGRDLTARIAHAGRALPRPVARAARALAQAQGLSGHPRLLRMVNPAEFAAAHRLVVTHLQGIDLAERRKTLLLRTASRLVLNLLAIVALLVAVLVWRGYV